MPDIDITGLPLASAVADGDLLIKWDSTQVSGQRTQKFTAAQFRDYVVSVIPYGPVGPAGPKGDTGPQGLPGKDGNGAGSVTSVSLTTPADLTVSGSPITSAGTLAISRNPQAANVVMAGPASGANAAPTYRALVAADIPALPYTTTAQAAAAAPVQSVAGRTGAVTLAVADVSGAAKSGANTDITSLASPALGAATATTQAASDSSTKVATTAQVQAAIGANAGGGAPIAANQQSAAYTAVAADKGKTLILAGSSPLTLGPSTAVSGWYVWVKKSDGSGVWAITPSGGTIDGLSSINVYQESFLIWYDASASVYRTQGRPKGWIPMGVTTVTGNPASINFTTGFSDTELRDMQFVFDGISDAGSNILLRVQKSGAYQTSQYVGSYLNQNSSSVSSANVPTSGAMIMVSSGGFTYGDVSILNFATTSQSGQQRITSIGFDQSPTTVTSTSVQQTVAAITGVQFVPVSGTFNSGGTISQRGFRP